MLRCLIDSMVFDAIAAERVVLDEVDRLTRGRRVELLAAFATMREIAAVPDPDRRRRLQRVRVLVVPPAEPREPGARSALARMLASPGVSDEDAAIALAAAALGVPLVTEDRDLRVAAAAHLPRLELWTWEEDLRPGLASAAACAG